MNVQTFNDRYRLNKTIFKNISYRIITIKKFLIKTDLQKIHLNA